MNSPKKKTDPKTLVATYFVILHWNFWTISTKPNYFISFWLMHQIQHSFFQSLCVQFFFTEKTVFSNSLDVIITNGRPWKMRDKTSHPLWIASSRNGNVHIMRYIHFWNFNSAFARSSVASLLFDDASTLYQTSVLSTCSFVVLFLFFSRVHFDFVMIAILTVSCNSVLRKIYL